MPVLYGGNGAIRLGRAMSCDEAMSGESYSSLFRLQRSEDRAERFCGAKLILPDRGLTGFSLFFGQSLL
jgi:hypothetical protein